MSYSSIIGSYKLLNFNNGSSGVKVGKKGSALTLSCKL